MYSIGLTAALFASGTVRAEVSQNILSNPGFDSYSTSPWSVSNADEHSSFQTSGIGSVTIKPYDGNGMVYNNDNTTHVELSQSGNITDYLGTGGTRIYAGVFTTSNKKMGTECQLTVTYYDAADKIISQDTTGKVACATSTGIWQELKFMNTIPANTVAVNYDLEGFTADYSGYTLFDSAYLLIESCNGTCPPYSPLWGFTTMDQVIADTRAKCQENPVSCGIQPVVSQIDLDAARDSAAAVIYENLDIHLPLGYLLQNGGKTPLSADFEFVTAEDGSFTWKLKTMSLSSRAGETTEP